MRTRLSLPPDFSFLECINAHGWKSLQPYSWDAENATLSRAEYFGGHNPCLLSITADINDLYVECDSDIPEEDLQSFIARIFQLDLPMDEFHQYCAATKALRHVPAAKKGRMLRSPTVFEDIVKVITTTNTTWTQTKAMVARIVEEFGTPLPSNLSRHAFPTPAQLAYIPLEEFAAKAKLGYRNAAVHKIATMVSSGELDLESWTDPAMDSADLYKRLISLPGIGPYAASCLLIYLGHYDRVNVDSWARTLVGNELGRKVTDKETHEFFAPHGKWKALAYHFYPWSPSE